MKRFVYGTSQRLAWFGGLVLALLALLSVFSIAGRALSGLGLGPVPGDFELVEVGAAVAVFCFLPWAHLRRSHASVDLFWRAYPPPLQKVLAVVADALMLLVWLLLVWRMGVALQDYRGNGEVSFILQMPVWWGYALCMPAAAFGCLAYVWRLLETLGLARAPTDVDMVGAAH